MNQSFRMFSKTAKLSKGFSRVNNKVSLNQAFSKSTFVPATSATSNSKYTSTFSNSSSFCTAAATSSNGGSIINNRGRSNIANSISPSFLEILALGEDDDDR